jgi:hypothetical protein
MKLPAERDSYRASMARPRRAQGTAAPDSRYLTSET